MRRAICSANATFAADGDVALSRRRSAVKLSAPAAVTGPHRCQKVLSAVRLPADLALGSARGQYAAGWQGGRQVIGFLEEDGIPADSRTETYAAVQLSVDTRRWAGVPFYLRTGKRLTRRMTEIAVVFQRAPHLPFAATDTKELGKNALVIRVQPDEGVTVRFGSKVPGSAPATW